MSRARLTLEPAFVLNARPYSETSLLIEAFTRAQGRVGLVARGARSPKARLRALLQPLQPLLLSWSEGGELGTLTGAESAGPPIALSGERVFLAWYVNELLLRLLQRNDAHPGLFEAYAVALPELGGAAPEAALRIFEKRLLGEIGYGLDLPASLQAESDYEFDGENAAMEVRDGGAFRGSSLIALRDEQFSDARALSDARKLLRRALDRQLGGRELKTRELLRQMRAR
jgi:DNA repair protein RecO (recombination protein O)